MIRNILVRLFRCFVAFIGIVVASVSIAVYLALQQPAFYAELRSRQFSESEMRDVNASFQLMANDFRQWVSRSLVLQRGQLSDLSIPAAAGAALAGRYDPAQDTRFFSVTEEQINVRLASSNFDVSREWQNPRVQIRQECVDFAFEFVVCERRCVLSVELKPTVTLEGRLRIDLAAARVGRLPLPLKRIFSCLPRDAFRSTSDVELHLTAPTPHVYLRLSGDDPKFPAVKSIKCAESEITVEFLAPVVKLPQNKGVVPPHALSRRD
jgi:hypothetical protein